MATPEVKTLAESTDREGMYIDADAEQRVNEFIRHLENSSGDEQRKRAKVFNQKANQYMDPELKSNFTGTSTEKKENSNEITVTNSDIKNAEEVKELNEALRAYPNLPEAHYKAINDMVYGPVNRIENHIGQALNQNQKEKSDKNIEK